MDISLNKDQQKSVLLTTIVVGLLLLILFFVRFWPPSNLKELLGGGGGGGIEMNFGDSDYGMGDNFKSETLNVKEEQSKQTPATASPEDNPIFLKMVSVSILRLASIRILNLSVCVCIVGNGGID